MDTFNAGRKLVRIPKDVTSFSNRATRVPNVVSHAKVFFEKNIISDVVLTRNEKKMFQFSTLKEKRLFFFFIPGRGEPNGHYVVIYLLCMVWGRRH